MVDLNKRYVSTDSPDGTNGANFSLGMSNQLGYLSIFGAKDTQPGGGGAGHQIGLVKTFDVEEETGLETRTYAFGKWVEPIPKVPLWTINCTRDTVRSRSIKRIVWNSYGLANGVTFDWQWLPFLMTFDFEHAPPLLGAPSFYTAQWAYYKVLVRNYRFRPAPTAGPDNIEEAFTAVAVGESFTENGKQLWTSEKQAWGSNYFSTTSVVMGGVANALNNVTNQISGALGNLGF